MGGKRPQIAIRIQALALIEEGVPIRRVMEATGMAKSSIFRLRKTARERGYNPEVSRQLKEEYVDDATRSGRPKSMTEEQRKSVVDRVKEQREGRWQGGEGQGATLTHKELGDEFGVSKVTIRRLLRVSGIGSLQPPPKPKVPAPPGEGGLQPEQEGQPNQQLHALSSLPPPPQQQQQQQPPHQLQPQHPQHLQHPQQLPMPTAPMQAGK